MIRAKIEWPIGSRRALVLGFVLAALLAACLMLTARPAHADTTFTVTRTDDAGDPDLNDNECGFFAGRGGRACSLRAAIEQANATAGADTINFNIPDDPNEPGNEVKTILPATDLPTITEQVTIDGYTQPGSKSNSKQAGGLDAVILVELNGINGDAANGLEIDAPNVVVRGLAINFFGDNGILTLDDAKDARIEGNFIGTNASGTQNRGNGATGVNVLFSPNTTVGGTSPAARNLISGNDREGVRLNSGSDGSKVLGNLIGTQKDGTSPLGNSQDGVDISGSSNNFVGDGTPGAANTIAFNGDVGVTINTAGSDPNNAKGNRVLSNSIFSNTDDGIGLPSGRTVNDPKDRDAGPNTLQNFPVLTSVESAGEDKDAIKGKLNSTPNKKFTIQFFSNPLNEDEGKKFIGQKKVTTNRKGKASFTFETSQVSGSENITATATGPGGNTSEFSDPLVKLT